MKIPTAFWRVLCALALTAAGQLRAADATSSDPKHGYTVNLEVKVSETGVPEHIAVVSSEDETTGEILSKMAIAMAANTKFPPREKNGAPAKYTARVPFFFPIEDDEGPAANNQPKPRGRGDVSIQPTYPPEMAARGEVGGVVFEMVINEKGDLARLTTLRASHPEFEKAARDAVSTWKFHPAEKDGRPVETRWRIAVVFETADAMADLKWRVAPRPSLGSFVVTRTNRPIEESSADAKPETAPAASQPPQP